jgi:hypothetical protein
VNAPQLDLFAPAPPCVRSSPTSVAAAEAIAPDVPALERRVLEWLRDRGEFGGTDQEMQESLAMTPDTQRPRRWTLQKLGLVADSGRRRKTRTGRDAVVWISTEAQQ